MNLNSILIGSDQPEVLTAYYTKVFGKPDYQESGYAGWQLGAVNLSVGPHSEVHGKSAHPGRILLNIESDDVAGEFARMKAAGAIVIREPYQLGENGEFWVATLADPDDNYFQLQTPYQMGNDQAG
jgi:predicted enzyme related to lactoylglutathione lyase